MRLETARDVNNYLREQTRRILPEVRELSLPGRKVRNAVPARNGSCSPRRLPTNAGSPIACSGLPRSFGSGLPPFRPTPVAEQRMLSPAECGLTLGPTSGAACSPTTGECRAMAPDTTPTPAYTPSGREPPDVRDKIRIRFRKGGDLRLLSHHDLMRSFERMLRRAALPLRNSQGFHPKPRLVLRCRCRWASSAARKCWNWNWTNPTAGRIAASDWPADVRRG